MPGAWYWGTLTCHSGLVALAFWCWTYGHRFDLRLQWAHSGGGRMQGSSCTELLVCYIELFKCKHQCMWFSCKVWCWLSWCIALSVWHERIAEEKKKALPILFLFSANLLHHKHWRFLYSLAEKERDWSHITNSYVSWTPLVTHHYWSYMFTPLRYY